MHAGRPVCKYAGAGGVRRGGAPHEMTKPAVEARAFWIAEPKRGEIRKESLHAPAADEALVRTLYTGVSRGTEALVFNGKVPRSEYERMLSLIHI